MSKSKSLIKTRSQKVKRDISLYFDKALATRKINKNLYGYKSAAIAYALISIQRQAIDKNKSIICPSLETLAQATGASIRQVNRIIDQLVKSKAISFANYFDIDKLTGEVKTSSYKTKNRSITKKNTNGRLRRIINPLAKVREFIESKRAKVVKTARSFAQEIFVRYVNRYIDRQEWKEHQENNEEVLPPDPKKVNWDIMG